MELHSALMCQSRTNAQKDLIIPFLFIQVCWGYISPGNLNILHTKIHRVIETLAVSACCTIMNIPIDGGYKMLS